MIKIIKTQFLALALLCLSVFALLTPAHANEPQLKFVATAQTGHFVRNKGQTNGTTHKNGELPFIGTIGFECQINPKFAVFTHYIHRSNIDLTRHEYWYDSVNVGVRFTHCLWHC